MQAYQPDRSLKGKLRRRLVRLACRKPAARSPERPMISFTFDDAPASAATAGAALLEARGLRGVYYIAAALAGCEGLMGRFANQREIERLALAGHEIGCHTYSHLDLGQASAGQTAADIDLNMHALVGWKLPRPRSFAYPYGDVSAPAKRTLSGRFSTLRALHHGVIGQGADLNQAPAVGIEGPDGEMLAQHWMGVAKAKSAWLILYTHDVADQPSEWGCTPAALERLIDRAVADGFDVVTVAEGAQRLAA